MENKFSVKEVLLAFHLIECARYRDVSSLPKTLQILASEKFSNDELVTLLIRRYALAHFFVGMLECMSEVIKQSTIEDPLKQNLLLAVTKNLSEEKGENPEYGGPHIEGRVVCLKHFGFDYELLYGGIGNFLNPQYHSVLSTQPAYMKFVTSVKDLLTTGTSDKAVVAVAVLWYYEHRISFGDNLGDYPLVLDVFQKKGLFEKKDEYSETEAPYHIWSHSQHDPFHAELCENALNALPDEYAKTVSETLNTMRMMFDKFWEDINPK